MQVGFKTGPKTWDEGKKIILEDRPGLCEVWFRIDKSSEYEDMVAFLRRHEVQIGLHHWGLAAKKYKTNLATNNEEIRQETLAQIKETIDIAADIEGVYVNAHPGAAQVEKVDLDAGRQEPVAGEQTDPEESAALFLAAAEELQVYANEKNVLFTLETMIAKEKYVEGDQTRLFDPQPVPLAVMGTLGSRNNWLANDISHTLASLGAWEADAARCWELFMAFTRHAAPFTRLLHINTLMLPFNGTDSHDGIMRDDFVNGVFPNRQQLIEALTLFRSRPDVFVIPEPHSHMQDNWRALQDLVKSI